MYNNLIEEDIMILDNEFFKIDTMFETVDRIYDIKQRELEYNYIYTESINEEYIDLYTEAEEAKSKNEQGLLGRLFTAILNFIRSIRAKILRLFGNDKKAAELEAKIKGNPKLANQTVEITNTVDAEKAINEGTGFFAGLIDKVVKGTATEADADAAEEKNKSLLSRIGIFGGGALLAAGGVKVASDKLKEHGVTKQTIKENVSNLLKRERETKKKADETTKQTEEMAKKGEDALKNNSQSGNEENTKAGRRIMGSFKGFITDVGKLFTGKVSELKSKINSVFSNNDADDKQTKPENKVEERSETQTSKKDDGSTSKTKPNETNDKTKPENKIKEQSETPTNTNNNDKAYEEEMDTIAHKLSSFQQTMYTILINYFTTERIRNDYHTEYIDSSLLHKLGSDKMDPFEEPVEAKRLFDVGQSSIKICEEIIKTKNEYNAAKIIYYRNKRWIPPYHDFKDITYDQYKRDIIDIENLEKKYKEDLDDKDIMALKERYRKDNSDIMNLNNKCQEAINKLEIYLDDIKKNYMSKLKEYIEKKPTHITNESSYDLINDILAIFENSF